MHKNKITNVGHCQNMVVPKRLIVDDRNKNEKARKAFNPVDEQEAYEFSQIPFDKKIKYATRYFKDHCEDCYCRDPLVSPTSKYLYKEDNSSDNDENLMCTCPLNHPCNLKCLSKDSDEYLEDSAPFLRSKRKQYKKRIKSPRKRYVSSCSDKSSCERHYKNEHVLQKRPVSSCSDKTTCDQYHHSQKSSQKHVSVCSSIKNTCESSKNNSVNQRRIVKSHEIIENNTKYIKRSHGSCSGDSNSTRKNSKPRKNSSVENDLDYTKQRQKYECHRVPRVCLKHKHGNNQEDNLNETVNIDNNLDVRQVSDFREQYYFDTHDPFRKNLQNVENLSSQSIAKNMKSIQIDRAPYLNRDPAATQRPCQRCVYSFELNSRLQPIPLNADVFGRSCCDACGKPMSTVRNSNNNNTKSKDLINKEAGVNCKLGTTCNIDCKVNQQNECSKLCPALEPQRIHIGCGNERIKLTIPSSLLGESIGQSVEITSKPTILSIGSKPKVQSKRSKQEKVIWNSDNKGKVNPAERPNSFALRQQKFSMYNRK